MRHRPRDVAVVVSLALLTASGFATPAVAAPGNGPAPAQQGSGGACDYAELYDETIDSVVSIQGASGLGSGFVYNGSGNGTSYVVTNAHVVGDAPNVTVQFTRGESRTGTVVGTDVFSDLAVVRVPDTPGYVEALAVAETPPEHGERVAALGSPFGLEETITSGIVSGLNRSMPTQLGFAIPNVIQTDAPISPGNSGGPLVTCDGVVAGVNTAGIAAQGAENIGFAVSASSVQRVVPSLIQTGEFRHPTLGISATAVTPAVAEAGDLNVTSGVMVATVDENAPAANALQGAERLEQADGQIVPVGGDVIVSVEGRPVATTEDLASVLLAETEPGDEVNLTVIRDGERVNVTTRVTARTELVTPTPTR